MHTFPLKGGVNCHDGSNYFMLIATSPAGRVYYMVSAPLAAIKTFPLHYMLHNFYREIQIHPGGMSR